MGDKFQNNLNLFPRHAEFLHKLVNAHVLKLSNTVETGIRVFVKTYAPLRLPGMLSTAGHCDQSSVVAIAKLLLFFQRKAYTAICHGFQASRASIMYSPDPLSRKGPL